MTSGLNPSATFLGRIKWEADPAIEIDHSPRVAWGSPGLLKTILTLPRRWRQRVQDRRHLSGLSDSVLDDIGLTRGEVVREASKPFWRPFEPRRVEFWRPVEPPRTGASRH